MPFFFAHSCATEKRRRHQQRCRRFLCYVATQLHKSCNVELRCSAVLQNNNKRKEKKEDNNRVVTVAFFVVLQCSAAKEEQEEGNDNYAAVAFFLRILVL
jgi:hypothetical protein